MSLSDQDRTIYEYALKHLEWEKAKLDAKIEELRSRLGGGSQTKVSAPAKARTLALPEPPKPPRKKRVMSPEGKARLVAALKKRWASVKKAKRQAAKTA